MTRQGILTNTIAVRKCMFQEIPEIIHQQISTNAKVMLKIFASTNININHSWSVTISANTTDDSSRNISKEHFDPWAINTVDLLINISSVCAVGHSPPNIKKYQTHPTDDSPVYINKYQTYVPITPGDKYHIDPSANAKNFLGWPVSKYQQIQQLTRQHVSTNQWMTRQKYHLYTNIYQQIP